MQFLSFILICIVNYLCDNFWGIILIVQLVILLYIISYMLHIYFLLMICNQVIYTYLCTMMNDIFPFVNLRDDEFVEMLFVDSLAHKSNDTYLE